MVIHPVVIQFVDMFLKSEFYRPVTTKPRERFANWRICPLSREMCDNSSDLDGLVRWKPVDSPIDEPIIAGFERFLDVPLPPSFKSYLMYKCLLGVCVYRTSLPEVHPHFPLGWLEWSALASNRPFLKSTPWLIPFAERVGQKSLFCFDTRCPQPNGEYPIILCSDHNPASHEPSTEVHESFESYLRFLCHFLEFSRDLTSPPFPKLPLQAWLERQGFPVPNEVRPGSVS